MFECDTHQRYEVAIVADIESRSLLLQALIAALQLCVGHAGVSEEDVLLAMSIVLND